MSTADRYLAHAAELRARAEAEHDDEAAEQLTWFAQCYVTLAEVEVMSLNSPEWAGGISGERQTRGHILSPSFH